MRTEMEPVRPGDKEITIYIKGIRVLIDYDDVNHKTADKIADIIVAAATGAK